MRTLGEKVAILVLSTYLLAAVHAADPTKTDSSTPPSISGMTLAWSDEFNVDGKPDTKNWKYETGFVRNQELQWYQSGNASCKGGALIIEGRKEQVTNPNYLSGSTDWKRNRQYASYTSASINTSGLQSWKFGHFEIRSRINTQKGSWPAIWTLGNSGEWPSNGEIDIMEFYLVSNTPSILANFAWGTSTRWVAQWDGASKPLSTFLAKDSKWAEKFHIWSMDWNKDTIRLSLDGELMNETLLSKTLNPDDGNPFLQNHYLLLNLALGANGGDPSQSTFPIVYEVDYVRVYQKATDIHIAARTDNASKTFTLNCRNKQLLITAPDIISAATPLSIFNLQGVLITKKIIQPAATGNEYSVSLNTLPAGAYTCRLDEPATLPQLFILR